MKKVKFMFLSLLVFAVVGGALAFKAKFHDQDYCTTSQVAACNNPGAAICPNFETTSSFDDQNGVLVCTTDPQQFLTTDETHSFFTIGCSTNLIADDPNSVVPLPCLATKKIKRD